MGLSLVACSSNEPETKVAEEKEEKKIEETKAIEEKEEKRNNLFFQRKVLTLPT